MDKNLLREQCRDIDWILSDFFETIVHRTVPETMIRQLWAKSVALSIGSGMQPELVYNLRLLAAKNVFRERCDGCEEIRYELIITELYTLLHASLPTWSAEQFWDLCYHTELQIESEHLVIDQEIISFYRSELLMKKKIAVVSDFYMGKAAIEFFLDKLHVADVFEQIFVSSDYGVKKASGKLYQTVKDILGINHNAIMIGDHQEADVEQALKAGLKAYHKKSESNYSVLNEKLELKRIAKAGKEQVFANYAFMYYYFIEKIYKRLMELEKREVSFIAREGFFLKYLFDEYQKWMPVKVESHYLCVSRKSTLLSSLAGKDEKEFNVIFKSYKDLNIISFLKNLSFSQAEIQKVISELSFNCDEIIYGLNHSPEFRELLDNVSFQLLLDEKCQKAKRIFKKYIQQIMPEEDEELIVVDVGWKGTIQDNIFLSLEKHMAIRGLYLGYENKTGYESNKNIKEGLVFSKYPYPSEFCAIWDFETHLIEQMMAAPHGSAAGYTESDSKILVVFEDYSIEDKKLYALSGSIQANIMTLFIEIAHVFYYSLKSAEEMTRFFVRIHLRTLLVLDRKCIEYESIALTPKTNNFGWFEKIPTRTSKKQKLYSMMRDLSRIKETNKGLMPILSYFAIKMNARNIYSWKKIIYRLIYFYESLKLIMTKRTGNEQQICRK